MEYSLATSYTSGIIYSQRGQISSFSQFIFGLFIYIKCHLVANSMHFTGADISNTSWAQIVYLFYITGIIIFYTNACVTIIIRILTFIFYLSFTSLKFLRFFGVCTFSSLRTLSTFFLLPFQYSSE